MATAGMPSAAAKVSTASASEVAATAPSKVTSAPSTAKDRVTPAIAAEVRRLGSFIIAASATAAKEGMTASAVEAGSLRRLVAPAASAERMEAAT
jgi:hypothetical protein